MPSDGVEMQAPEGGLIYPPGLAHSLFRLFPEQPLLRQVGESALAELLSTVFFASLQREEGEHQPLRLVVMGPAGPARVAGPGQLTFRVPCACTSRHLLRLGRGARSERISIAVAKVGAELAIVGLARDRFGADESGLIRITALQPGQLEVWIAGERILEYAHGCIRRPPEDVLLAAGPVRQKLLGFAAQSGAPDGYIESIGSVLRHLANHPHGGILVLSRDIAPHTSVHDSFAIRPETHLWDLLHAMKDVKARPGERNLDHETLRSEIQQTIGEISDMTALDGATILDRRLGLCGFGIVLPVRADVSVLEVVDAAGTLRRPFSLDQYGARHRAAASYAATHPGSLVFIASVSGDFGCMLCEEHGAQVLLWRFRARDLVSPAP